MDLLSGLSREQFHIYIWVAVAVFVVAGGIFQPRRLHRTALGAVVGFAALNAGAAIYVLNHYADPRWSSEEASRLNAPSLADMPLVGQFMGPLDSALNSVVTGVNEFLAFKDALPVALDFMAIASWAMLLFLPVAVLTAIVNYVLAKRRSKRLEKYKADVDDLKRKVAALESFIEQLPIPRAVDAENFDVNTTVSDTNMPMSPRPVG